MGGDSQKMLLFLVATRNIYQERFKIVKMRVVMLNGVKVLIITKIQVNATYLSALQEKGAAWKPIMRETHTIIMHLKVK